MFFFFLFIRPVVCRQSRQVQVVKSVGRSNTSKTSIRLFAHTYEDELNPTPQDAVCVDAARPTDGPVRPSSPPTARFATTHRARNVPKPTHKISSRAFPPSFPSTANPQRATDALKSLDERGEFIRSRISPQDDECARARDNERTNERVP